MKFNVAMVRSGLQDRLETLEQLRDSGEYVVENINMFGIIRNRLGENGFTLTPLYGHTYVAGVYISDYYYLKEQKTCQLTEDMEIIQKFLDRLHYIDVNESQIDEKEIPSRVREILIGGR